MREDNRNAARDKMQGSDLHHTIRKKSHTSGRLSDELKPGDVIAESQIRKEDGRVFRISLTLLKIEPTPFSKSLIYHYQLQAHSDVPDSYLSSLGFNGTRLRTLGLVPSSVLLAQSSCEKELESEALSRYHKALIGGFEKWLSTKNFNQKMKEEIARHVQNGPESRFRESQ